MGHLDEKIIAMMNALSMNNEEVESQTEDEEAKIELVDLTQPFVNIAGEQVAFTEVSLFDNQLSIMLPRSFELMTPKMAVMKYPSQHRPELIYTNDTGTINLMFNHTATPLLEQDMELFKDNMVETMLRTQILLHWYDDGIEQVNGKWIGYCNFLSPAINANIYNLMFFAELNGRSLIGTFNCTDLEMNDWGPIGGAILDSLKFMEYYDLPTSNGKGEMKI